MPVHPRSERNSEWSELEFNIVTIVELGETVSEIELSLDFVRWLSSYNSKTDKY